ncbi:myelin-oligodendrocyte glycoprotein-like isoform X2 [Dicentrarchus labrax]|uniref:myelin-oligodendrocyte glycoprotein-like isoform X2 n=1 Tax=Dicentrarchus labrax TaxID=13489 RepID=UPI0021F66A4B|nr:myelin-oligodendrocyte glycoprotein-like isoform X2 [Dicentrarchus labrax]
MKLLLVLMSSLSLVDADSDVIGSDKPVTVTVGDNVILPCHLEPPFNVRNLTVEWKRGETIVHIYTNRKDDPRLQDKNFRGRTSLFHEEMIRGNISLKLTSITELDAGSYTCFVPKLQSQVRKGFVNLTVEPVEQKKDKGSPTHKNNRQPENVGQEDNVWANVGSNVGANVLSNVWANVGSNVGANVGSNVGDNVERMPMLKINTRQEDNPETNVGSSDGASKDNAEDNDVETKL